MMNLSKAGRYALYAAMAMAEGSEQVTAAQVAARFRIPASVLAKVFQQLVRAGIAVGTRGQGGGYRLARPPSALTVLDVLAVFDPPRPPDRCLLADSNCADDASCRLRRLFDEVDEVGRATLGSVTLSTLVGARRGERPA
jgi:Rrf2 family protein